MSAPRGSPARPEAGDHRRWCRSPARPARVRPRRTLDCPGDPRRSRHSPYCRHQPSRRSLTRARGAIVNLGSTRALQSEPDTAPYAATKGGIVALTHALAVSLGPAIRVNCISPGWIATDEL